MVGIIKNYIAKRIELLKLELMEQTSNLVSILIYVFIILTLVMMFFFLFSFAIGLLIGELLGNTGLGILIFSLFYLIAFFVLLLNYNRLRKYTMRKIIEFQLNYKENANDDKD